MLGHLVLVVRIYAVDVEVNQIFFVCLTPAFDYLELLAGLKGHATRLYRLLEDRVRELFLHWLRFHAEVHLVLLLLALLEFLGLPVDEHARVV